MIRVWRDFLVSSIEGGKPLPEFSIFSGPRRFALEDGRTKELEYDD